MEPSIHITQDTIRAWQAEKAVIEQRMRADHERLSILHRRMETLTLYLEPGEPIPPEWPTIPSTPPQNLAQLPAAAAVEAVLTTAHRPLRAADILRELTHANYPVKKLGVTGSNLYAILNRMVRTGRLIKHDYDYTLTSPPAHHHTSAETPCA